MATAMKRGRHAIRWIGAATLLLVSWCRAISDDRSYKAKPVAVDADRYADFMANEALDVQDLAEGAELQRRTFNRMTPPGLAWVQPMLPAVAPFDATNFDDKFLDELLGEDRNSVAVYPLTLALDPNTRETWIYNAEGKPLAALPAEKTFRAWPEGSDPARVVLWLDLLPVEDVEPYLYVEDRIADSLAAVAEKAAKPARKEAAAKSNLSGDQFGFADARKLTNGNVRLTVTNGTDTAEIYSFTVWHTSSTAVVVWTNDLDEVVVSTNVVWTPVSSPYDGIESAWESRTNNLTLTNGAGMWEDANVASNARTRYYATAKRADGDSDGLTDGTEIFLYRTDPGVADTDGDGHADGREIALATDPLDGGDYFGVVINAALPIHNPPANPGEWVELFNAGPSTKSLAGFRLQTARPAGWTNVFTFPAGASLASGDFLVVGTNGDFEAALLMPDSYYNPPAVFGIRLVAPAPSAFVADALMYGFTNEYGFSLDGFGAELPIVRPKLTNVIRRTWVGYDSDHAGDWKNVPFASWPPHTQGDYLDLDGDGLSNAQEISGGIYPKNGGSRLDEPDTDGDGLDDGSEAIHGTDANKTDTDGDAFPWGGDWPPRGNDADEISNGSNPLDRDTDDDGMPDGWELGGGLNPLSTDSDENAMPDGNEDSDGDGIPNADEVGNLTNPFDAEDVDPRPYLWAGQDPNSGIIEGDIGYGRTREYGVVTRPDSQPIIVHIIEYGYMEEAFDVDCTVPFYQLNPEDPPTNRVYCIVPGEETNFVFYIMDGKTTWPNETEPEYGADIRFTHSSTAVDLDANVPEESEESVGFLLADKSAHPNAERRQIQIKGISGGEYLTNVIITYDTAHLTLYDAASSGNVVSDGAVYPAAEAPLIFYAQGILHSGMQAASVTVIGDRIPVHDSANATVLKADVGVDAPLADRALHPEAARQSLQLEQTKPGEWNGLMQLSLSRAVAFWSPTGGVPIALGETVFTNSQLARTIYLEGDGCGTGQASFSVVGLSDCVTNVPLHVFGVNATLNGVAELDEVSPGGFIADISAQTNASRTALALEAFGPSGSPGNLVLSWDSSLVRIFPEPTGGTALTQFVCPLNGFSGTNLYLEGIAPGNNNISWRYSEQSDCVDVIQITVLKVDLGIDVDDDGDVDDNDEAKEESPGAIIFENWDNDYGDVAHTPDKYETSVTDENDLVPIYPKLEPTLNTGTLKLEATAGGSRVKVWTSATKGTEVPLPKTWNLATETVPATLYLEGYEESASANDIELKMSYANGGSPICDDKIKLTVVRLNLATVVHRELDIPDYEWLTWLPALGCSSINYDHAGLVTAYNGQRTRQSLTNDTNWEVMEMQSGIGIHTVSLADFKRPSPSSSLAYFGASRNPNSYENDSTRNALLYTANYMISFVSPAYPSFLPAGIPKAIEYSSGNGFISDPVSVWALRCDALPEFVYEWVGVPLWSNTYTGHTSIRYYPEDHNDRPDCSIDADRELSPRAQWGGFGNGNTTLLLIQNYQPGLTP